MHNSSNLKPVKDADGRTVPGLYKSSTGALIVRDQAGLERSRVSHQAIDSINTELAALKAQVQMLMERLK